MMWPISDHPVVRSRQWRNFASQSCIKSIGRWVCTDSLGGDATDKPFGQSRNSNLHLHLDMAAEINGRWWIDHRMADLR